MSTPTTSRTRPLHVLFLCTHNSARSQIAEALMTRKVERLPFGRFRAASAGSTPAAEVHPTAVEALRRHGALPVETLERRALELRVQEIATSVPVPNSTAPA